MPSEPELAPFVLIVSNDPDENPIINQIDVPDAVFLTDVSIPIQAIASARDGRGRLAVQQLNRYSTADTIHMGRTRPTSACGRNIRRGTGDKEEEFAAGLTELVALDTATASSAPAA